VLTINQIDRKIGVLRFPGSSAGAKPIYNLVDILQQLFEEIHVISGNKVFENFDFEDNVKIHSINHQSNSNPILKILNYIRTQVKLCIGMNKDKKVKNYFFLESGGFLLLPLLFAKLLGKNVFFIMMGSILDQGRKNIYTNILEIISNICLFFSDGIIVYTPRLIQEWGLEEYEEKIYVAHRHIINLDKFTAEKELYERVFDVGYIGRFSGVKNVTSYIRSISFLNEKNDKMKFFIGGDGNKKDKVLNCIQENSLEKRVTYPGWISRNDLPRYLNDIKLLVLPSHSEGLPNIMLEAMSCGTPVLASSVGSVPDIIEHGKNGFLLKDNSPNGIARNVLQVFENYDLGKIGKNARKTVEEEFNRKATIANFRETLSNIYE